MEHIIPWQSVEDPIVIAIILGLLGASIWCWAIMIEKTITLKRLNKRAKMFDEAFWSGQPLDKLYERMDGQPKDPLSSVFYAAMREWKRAEGLGSAETDTGEQSLRMRIERVMNITIDREMERINKFMTVLATTASTAPFVGLFGTVWGIMNSFSQISSASSASLQTVAGPISEALFATAIGLFAAIPAVIGYNKISRDIDRYGLRLDTFAGEFSAIISRRLSERKSKKAQGQGN
ncbi:MAG: protein TolQ [Alphaproteobacteria bacterium]